MPSFVNGNPTLINSSPIARDTYKSTAWVSLVQDQGEDHVDCCILPHRTLLLCRRLPQLFDVRAWYLHKPIIGIRERSVCERRGIGIAQFMLRQELRSLSSRRGVSP